MKILPTMSRGIAWIGPDGAAATQPFQVFRQRKGNTCIRVGDNLIVFEKSGKFDGEEAKLTSANGVAYQECLARSIENDGRAPREAYFPPGTPHYEDETAAWKTETPRTGTVTFGIDSSGKTQLNPVPGALHAGLVAPVAVDVAHRLLVGVAEHLVKRWGRGPLGFACVTRPEGDRVLHELLQLLDFGGDTLRLMPLYAFTEKDGVAVSAVVGAAGTAEDLAIELGGLLAWAENLYAEAPRLLFEQARGKGPTPASPLTRH